jgi:hypothetical protein
MPLEFVVPNLRFLLATHMTDTHNPFNKGYMNSWSSRRITYVAGFNQVVEKKRQKAWHDHNIHQKILQPGYLVLLYEKNIYNTLASYICIGWVLSI